MVKIPDEPEGSLPEQEAETPPPVEETSLPAQVLPEVSDALRNAAAELGVVDENAIRLLVKEVQAGLPRNMKIEVLDSITNERTAEMRSEAIVLLGPQSSRAMFVRISMVPAAEDMEENVKPKTAKERAEERKRERKNAKRKGRKKEQE